ncbi:MAG: ATP-binding protein [Ferruginibacter sp.]
MKKILFLTLLLFGYANAFTQSTQEITDLQHQLAIAKDDTSRIKAQIGLCYIYRLGNTDSSLLYGQRALKLSEQINYPRGEILALSFMGLTMQQLGNLPKALELAFKALEIGKTYHLERLTGAALNAIGETYIILKDYTKALHYLHIQKANAEAYGSEEGLAYSKYDLGIAFKEMNQLDSSLFYEQQSIGHFKKINREEPLVYAALGDIQMKSGKNVEALKFYKQSLQSSLTNNERRASASAYNKIAIFFSLVNQSDSAIYYATKGLEESTLISKKKTIQEAAALLSELYESTDAKASLRYLKIADAYKDSLFGTGNLQAVQTLVAHEEQRQKEIEATKIEYQNKFKQYALMAGLAMLLLIAFFLYRSNRKEKNAKNLLQQKNKVIEQTLINLKSTQSQLIQSEKMASLGELTAGIAHEIQNPLNFVNNFSEVSNELIDEMNIELDKGDITEAKAIAAAVKQNLEKINHHGKRADAIVKGMLQHSRSSSGIKEPTDINALADEYLRLSYHGLRAKDKSFNATFKTDFEESLEKINIIPQDIGRVILNLLTNAFYAVDEKKKLNIPGYEPTVTVSTSRSPVLGRGVGGEVIIKVSDNGNGIPQKVLDKIFQPFFTTKPTGQGTGLGLSLSYDIVKAHGGELNVETKEFLPDDLVARGEGSTAGKAGTTFIIKLPL